MKKVLLCCAAALFMFSCSNEEEIQKPDTSKEVQTDDPAIGYKSPFDYPTVNLTAVPYVFKNDTDLDFELVAYVGLAFHDGVDDLMYFGSDMLNYNIPTLITGGLEYGNTIPSVPLKFPASSFTEIKSHFCPTRGPGIVSPTNPTGMFFDVESLGAVGAEEGLLAKMGKVYYFKYDALDTNGGSVASGLVKIFFPENAGGPNWNYGGTDALLGDVLMYESTTREICVRTDANSSNSPYSYHSEFTYAGQGYRIYTQIDANAVYTYMEYY